MKLNLLERYEPSEEEIESEALVYSREPVGLGALRELLALRIRHKMLVAEYQALAKDVELKTADVLKNLRAMRKGPQVISRKW